MLAKVGNGDMCDTRDESSLDDANGFGVYLNLPWRAKRAC